MTTSAAHRKFFSLRARLTWLLALAVLLTLGTAAKIVDWRTDTELQQRFDASLLTRAQALAGLVEIEAGGIGMEDMDAASAAFPGNSGASWYSVQCGAMVVARTVQPPPAVAAGETPAFTDSALPGGRRLRMVAFRFRPLREDNRGALPGDPSCAMRYGLDRAPLDDMLDTFDFILLGSLFGACALVTLLTPWLVRRGLLPLSALGLAMTRIGPDSPGRRLPESDVPELAPLVVRFNEVLSRMDDGLARERRFATGLAHEFRTRLAELRMLVELEKRHPGGRDLGSVLGEVGTIESELEATVTALLQLTRIESGLEQTRKDGITVVPLVDRACARHQDVALARDVMIEFVTTCDPGCTIEADRALLEIVLDNLLGNAVAYAPGGTAVTVRVAREGLTVGNAAPSLHPDDLVNFGQRFWRKGAQDSGGHAGLGLALAGAAAGALGMPLEFALDNGTLRAVLLWAGNE